MISKIKVFISRAVNLVHTSIGGWYVILNKNYKTQIVNDTNNPQWNEEFIFEVDREEFTLQIEIWNAFTNTLLANNVYHTSIYQISNNDEIKLRLDNMPPNAAIYLTISRLSTENTHDSFPLYQEIEVVQKGPFSTIHLAKDSNGKILAIKKIQYNSKKALNSGMKEVWPLRFLRWENLAHYSDIFIQRDGKQKEMFLCLVMEYFTEGNLSTFIVNRKSRGFKIEEAYLIEYMSQIAQAVAYLHYNNYIHKAINPENIFFSQGYSLIKLADFGLSRDCYKGIYIAPEVQVTKRFTKESDIWSLGCVFYEMCDLNLGREYAEESGVGHRIFIKDIAKKIRRGYSKKLASLICKMLSRKPEDRPKINEVLNYLLDLSPLLNIKPLQKVEIPQSSQHHPFHGKSYTTRPVEPLSTLDKKLPFKVVYSDGGEFSKTHGVLNILRDDKISYCSTKSENVNIVLELDKGHDYGFILERCLIRKSGHAYTSPVQEGFIFVTQEYPEQLLKLDSSELQNCNIKPVLHFTFNKESVIDQQTSNEKGRFILLRLTRGMTNEGIDFEYCAFIGQIIKMERLPVKSIVVNDLDPLLKKQLSFKLQKAPEVPPQKPQLFVHPDISVVQKQAAELLEYARKSKRYGVKIYQDDGRYEGELDNGLREGVGAYYYPSGNTFIGEWKKGYRNGRGIYDYTNGNKYEGDWKDDQRHGKGTSWFSDGGIYTGDYREGKRNGFGVYSYPSGNQYCGSWVDGKRQGHGIYQYIAGERYEGEWYMDQRHGRGVSIFPNGERYEGYFERGLKHGKGTYVNPEMGIEYTGDFVAGQKHGYGKIVFTNKTREVSYEGQWKKDLIDGEGIMTYRDGDKCVGVWVNGVRVEVKKWILSDFKQKLKQRMNGKLSDTLFKFADEL